LTTFSHRLWIPGRGSIADDGIVDDGQHAIVIDTAIDRALISEIDKKVLSEDLDLV
jgi:hypothetical protein